MYIKKSNVSWNGVKANDQTKPRCCYAKTAGTRYRQQSCTADYAKYAGKKKPMEGSTRNREDEAGERGENSLRQNATKNSRVAQRTVRFGCYKT